MAQNKPLPAAKVGGPDQPFPAARLVLMAHASLLPPPHPPRKKVLGGQPEPEEGYTGFPAPVVAHSARIVIDRRYLIEETPQAVRQEMVDLLEGLKASRPGFSYELRDLWTIPPTMTERTAPVVCAVDSALGEVLGLAPDYVVSPGTYDQKHIDRIGRLHNCIAYGPGILDLAHQPDEYVGIDDMLDSAKVMALALNNLLGGQGMK